MVKFNVVYDLSELPPEKEC